MGHLTKNSLSTLLRDDDPAIVSLIREQLYELGTEDIHELEQLVHCDDAVVTRHIQEVLGDVYAEHKEQEFLLFCHSFPEQGDLEEGAWRLSAVPYPKVDMLAGRKLLDEWSRKLMLRLTDPSDPQKGIQDMSAFVTYELGFKGNEGAYYEADNSYLNRVIETRLGIPLTLSLIYIFLGNRLQLPIKGIGMPGRFLCAWDGVLFDPFNQGHLLTKEDCIRILEDMGISFQESFLSPVTNKAILMRMIHNLVNIYSAAEKNECQQKMINFIVALQS